MDQEKKLRQQLAKMMDWHEAHADLAAAANEFPAELRGHVPEGLPHSAWQLLEHIRLALWDIVEFCRDTRHKSPQWPEGYWPRDASPPEENAWQQSIDAIEESLEILRKMILDPNRDLFAPLPGGSGQTLLREMLLAVDHNSYHVGQLVLVRKALGAWKG